MFFKEDYVEQGPNKRRENLLEDVRFELRTIKHLIAMLVQAESGVDPKRLVEAAESQALSER